MMKISQGIQDIALVSHWPILPAATAARLPFNAACLPAQCYACLHHRIGGGAAAVVAAACLQSQCAAVQL